MKIKEQKKISSIILATMMLAGIMVIPTVRAYSVTSDIIDDFRWPFDNACPGYANTVWADVDGINNGGTYGIYDTMVVFQTISGLGYPEYKFGNPSWGKWYYFTPDTTSCGGSTDRGRQVIYFVDMLAPGFEPRTPSTWVSKSIPGVTIKASHDNSVCSGRPYDTAYQKVQAYRYRHQVGPITGTEYPGSWTIYDFLNSGEVMELYVTTDFCENTLDDLIIRVGSAGIKADIDGNGQITAADALLYLRYAVGQNIAPYSMSASDDVTCDGFIHADDALKVLRKAVGQDVNLNC